MTVKELPNCWRRYLWQCNRVSGLYVMQFLLVVPVTESGFWTLTTQIDGYDEMDLFCGLRGCVIVLLPADSCGANRRA